MRRRPDVVCQQVGGSVVGLDQATGRYFTVDGSGVLLWEQLASDTDVECLVSQLIAAYEVSPNVARRDVLAFLRDLRRQGLLQE